MIQYMLSPVATAMVFVPPLAEVKQVEVEDADGSPPGEF
jgi:hypothetical protein